MGARDMYPIRLLWLGIILAGLLGASASFAQQTTQNQIKEVELGASAFTLGAPLPAWVETAAIPETDSKQPIVARLTDTQFLVDRIPVAYVHQATLINDAASLTALGSISISFVPEYQRLELHSIYIHRGQEKLDRTKLSNIRFLQRELGLERGVYSGVVAASILVNDLRVGDTLDISYSIYGQNPVFGGKYQEFAAWDRPFPTLLRRVVLNYPTDRKIAWRMIGDRPLPPVAPKITVQNGMRRIEFEARPLPETVSEARAPADFAAFRGLQFSEFASWNDVAKWATGLFLPGDVTDGDLAEISRKLRALDSKEARVTAALEFVQTEIRYFSVSLGESSHRPAPPSAVLRRRYGDCKDKAFLLITLLRELGIDSRPVLLQIGRRRGLEKSLPSIQFFNHVIVQVVLNGKTYYLDPTRLGQHGRLDHMGQAHQGAQVLIVGPETQELSRIPSSAESFGADDTIIERVTLPKLGGEGELQSERAWTGVRAENLRVMLERVPHDQIFRSQGDEMARRYPGATLIGQPAIADNRMNNVLSITAKYKVPNLAVEKNGYWIVYFIPDNFRNVLLSPPTATRKTPLLIPAFPFRAKYSFEIEFPQQVSAFVDPHAQTIENRYFKFTTTEHFRGNVAKTAVELVTRKSEVDAVDYAKYSKDLRSGLQSIKGYVAVGKQQIKDKGGKQEFAQKLRNLRQEVIAKTGTAIKSGKLTGADLAQAHCNRATALADLGMLDQASRDANEAVRLAPNSTGILTCRAEVYFAARDFEKSIADYTKAISFGATESSTFGGRGRGKFFAGRLDEASDDFAKASEDANEEGKLYSEIWLAIVNGRAGKSVPDAIARRAKAEAHGEWPRPALAMFAGAVSPKELLEVLSRKKGDERQMALTEGYFYLGEYSIMKGDKKAAETYFEKAHNLGIIIYTEYIAAGLELTNLKKENALTSVSPPQDGAVAR